MSEANSTPEDERTSDTPGAREVSPADVRRSHYRHALAPWSSSA
jgi:hypothetical protein